MVHYSYISTINIHKPLREILESCEPQLLTSRDFSWPFRGAQNVLGGYHLGMWNFAHGVDDFPRKPGKTWVFHGS